VQYDCDVPKSQIRLVEQGRHGKGWVIGLTIKLRDCMQSGNIVPAKIDRIDDDGRVVVTFRNGLEATRPYEQVAVELIAGALETRRRRDLTP
jgi:hypothetical protein